MNILINSENITDKIPEVEGCRCEEVLCQEYWIHGELVEPANLIFIKFDDQWYRIYFDHGFIFWKTHEEKPFEWNAEELSAEYRLNNISEKLNIRGKTLVFIEINSIEEGNVINLSFQNGVTLSLVGEYSDYCYWRAT